MNEPTGIAFYRTDNRVDEFSAVLTGFLTEGGYLYGLGFNDNPLPNGVAYRAEYDLDFPAGRSAVKFFCWPLLPPSAKAIVGQWLKNDFGVATARKLLPRQIKARWKRIAPLPEVSFTGTPEQLRDHVKRSRGDVYAPHYADSDCRRVVFKTIPFSDRSRVQVWEIEEMPGQGMG